MNYHTVVFPPCPPVFAMPWPLLSEETCLQNPGKTRPSKGGSDSESLRVVIRNGPNTVSGSTDTKKKPNSVSFSGLTEFWGANSVSSSQPIICVPKRTHRVFRAELIAVELSEFSLPKQYSRSNIPPVS